jgi:hypothetical protein
MFVQAAGQGGESVFDEDSGNYLSGDSKFYPLLYCYTKVNDTIWDQNKSLGIATLTLWIELHETSRVCAPRSRAASC